MFFQNFYPKNLWLNYNLSYINMDNLCPRFIMPQAMNWTLRKVCINFTISPMMHINSQNMQIPQLYHSAKLNTISKWMRHDMFIFLVFSFVILLFLLFKVWYYVFYYFHFLSIEIESSRGRQRQVSLLLTFKVRHIKIYGW